MATMFASVACCDTVAVTRPTPCRMRVSHFASATSSTVRTSSMSSYSGTPASRSGTSDPPS